MIITFVLSPFGDAVSDYDHEAEMKKILDNIEIRRKQNLNCEYVYSTSLFIQRIRLAAARGDLDIKELRFKVHALDGLEHNVQLTPKYDLTEWIDIQELETNYIREIWGTRTKMKDPNETSTE